MWNEEVKGQYKIRKMHTRQHVGIVQEHKNRHKSMKNKAKRVIPEAMK